MKRYFLLIVGMGLLTASVDAQEARLVQTGKELYSTQQCARCHRLNDKGYKENKLDGVGRKVSADDMRKWLTAPAEMEAKLDETPKVKMSSRKRMKLTDDQVAALVAYLRTLR